MHKLLMLIVVLIAIGGIMYFMIETTLFITIGEFILKSGSLLVPLLLIVSIFALITYLPSKFQK